MITDKEMFDNIKDRVERINQLKEENTYDRKIGNFYQNGVLKIRDFSIPITKVNVVSDDKNNQFVDIVDKHFILPENITITKVNSFRDTSLFATFIEKYKDCIKENTITFTEEMLTELLTSKWDGKYNTLTPEATYIAEKSNQ